jgi:hypothetical protein
MRENPGFEVIYSSNGTSKAAYATRASISSQINPCVQENACDAFWSRPDSNKYDTTNWFHLLVTASLHMGELPER